MDHTFNFTNLEITSMDTQMIHQTNFLINPCFYSFKSGSSSVPIPISSTFLPVGLQEKEDEEQEQEREQEEELGAMKEMMYKIAAMQPVDIDPASIQKPKRRNVRISEDPQSVAARHRRERISEKIRILQRLVPGGTKMDTASMLDEAIRYVKFLKRQIRLLQSNSFKHNPLLDFQPLGSTASSSLDKPAPATASGGYANLSEIHEANPAAAMCFVHEVIRD